MCSEEGQTDSLLVVVTFHFVTEYYTKSDITTCIINYVQAINTYTIR
jgi:hypothetical protein